MDLFIRFQLGYVYLNDQIKGLNLSKTPSLVNFAIWQLVRNVIRYPPQLLCASSRGNPNGKRRREREREKVKR